MRGMITTQHHGGPSHSLITNETHLDLRLVRLDGDDRGNAGLH